jgi:hypothetical protein
MVAGRAYSEPTRNEIIFWRLSMPDDSAQPTDRELDIGWRWFEFHARQRLDSFKFFALGYGATMSLTLAFINTGTHFPALLLSIFSALLAIIFWQLDERNRQLIEIGEKIIDSCWRASRFSENLNPVQAARVRQQSGIRYRYAFLAGFAGCLAFSVAMFGLSVYMVNFPQTHVSKGP